MNKLQQAAEEAYGHDLKTGASFKQWVSLGMPGGKSGESYSSFIGGFFSGASYAAGSFAEWCSENGWSYWNGSKVWVHITLGAKTTAELYELWQQSL